MDDRQIEVLVEQRGRHGLHAIFFARRDSACSQL